VLIVFDAPAKEGSSSYSQKTVPEKKKKKPITQNPLTALRGPVMHRQKSCIATKQKQQRSAADFKSQISYFSFIFYISARFSKGKPGSNAPSFSAALVDPLEFLWWRYSHGGAPLESLCFPKAGSRHCSSFGAQRLFLLAPPPPTPLPPPSPPRGPSRVREPAGCFRCGGDKYH